MTLEHLLAMIEAAASPSRDIDLAVAQLFGRVVAPDEPFPPDVPRVSVSIDAALALPQFKSAADASNLLAHANRAALASAATGNGFVRFLPLCILAEIVRGEVLK